VAACCTSEPTEGEPVKNRWSKGSLENVAETSEPPVTMPSSAGSKYVGDVDFVRSEVRGVISDILIITRLPAANAADAGNTTTRWSGKFHGPMIPPTPSGEGRTTAFSPASRAARISLVARIH